MTQGRVTSNGHNLEDLYPPPPSYYAAVSQQQQRQQQQQVQQQVQQQQRQQQQQAQQEVQQQQRQQQVQQQETETQQQQVQHVQQTSPHQSDDQRQGQNTRPDTMAFAKPPLQPPFPKLKRPQSLDLSDQTKAKKIQTGDVLITPEISSNSLITPENILLPSFPDETMAPPKSGSISVSHNNSPPTIHLPEPKSVEDQA